MSARPDDGSYEVFLSPPARGAAWRARVVEHDDGRRLDLRRRHAIDAGRLDVERRRPADRQCAGEEQIGVGRRVRASHDQHAHRRDWCEDRVERVVDDDEAAAAQSWAERLGIDRSELLREALHRHLVRLRAETDIEAWNAAPLTAVESAFGQIADWGPAEDWQDWADATG